MLARVKKFRHERKRKKMVRGLENIEIPSLPTPVMSALKLLREGRESLANVGRELAIDPGCTARTLRLANAAGNGTARQITSVSHAAALLGREKLEVVLIAAAVNATMPRRRNRYFDATNFWRLSAQRASLARQLAARINPRETLTSFTIALLQDMAVPLLVDAHGEGYGEVLAAWRAGDEPLCDLERDVFAWDHSEVGYDLAQVWSLPDPLARGIEAHHGHDHSASALVAGLGEKRTRESVERIVTEAKQQHGIPEDETLGMLERALIEADDIVRSVR